MQDFRDSEINKKIIKIVIIEKDGRLAAILIFLVCNLSEVIIV